MNNDSELALSIRAKILPMIEGSNEFFSQLEQTPQRITAPMQQLTQNPIFQQGMSPKAMQQANALANDFEGLEDYEKRIRDLRNEIATTIKASELSEQPLTRRDVFGVHKKMLQEQAELEDFQKKQMAAIDEMDFSKEKRRKLKSLDYDKDRQLSDIDRDKGWQLSELDKDKKRRDILHKPLTEEEIKTKQESIEEETKTKKESISKQYDEQRLVLLDEIKSLDMKKEFMKEALVSGIKDASSGLDELNPKLKEMVGQMKEGGEAGKGIYTMLQQGGYLALMGNATQTAMNWTLSEARISAKELTSFNLTSPMGSYAAGEEAKVFKETTERTRESELIGKLVGAVAAIALTTVTGGAGAIPIAAMAAGGSMFGGMIGGQFAEIENTESRAKLEADIKYRSEAYAEASRLVQSSMAYDISKFKAGQRFGKEGIGGSVLGYSPDETLELQKSFAEQYGKMDEDLFKEQTLFARKSGLDPRQMYQFGEMERLTGNKLSYGEFSEVEKKSQQLFGTDVDKERVVDILKDIRDVSMKQLKAGIDTHEAIRFAVDLPRMLMGNASPYGRAGDLGAETSSAFERFGNPQNLAQESVLMRAWGENGMFGDDGYLSRRREGIMNPRNFRSAIEEYRREGGYTDKGAQAIMEGIDPGRTMAKPIYDKFVGLFGEKGEAQYDEYKLDKNGKRIAIKGEKDEKGEQKYEMESKTVKLEEFYKMVESEGKAIGEGGKEFLETLKQANSFRSAEEAQQVLIREKNLASAEAFKQTIFDGQKAQAGFWVDMGKNADVQKDMIETVRKGIDAQYAWMITSGIEKNPVKIKDFLNEQKEEAYERAGIKDPNKLSIEKRREILEEQGYKEIERRVQQAGSLPDEMKDSRFSDEKNKADKGHGFKEDRDAIKELKKQKEGEPNEAIIDVLKYIDQPSELPGKEKAKNLMEMLNEIKQSMKLEPQSSLYGEPQRQTPETKELTARLEGLETLNRTIDVLINRFDTLGDKIEIASLRQGGVRVEVKSADKDVYGQQTDFIEDRA
ncbi:MAG: hypothetical protein M0P61_00450 [Ignavibacteriaceae bacterium]|nr:hypothetical protein [Ignavibacteriaceae bacterium]